MDDFFAWIDARLSDLAGFLGVSTFDLNPLLAVVLLGLSCGMVGALVIGSRMAFFSDAMAHTALAGVAFALLGIVLAFGVKKTSDADPYLWLVPWAMAAFGVVAGVSMAYVRERTGLTYDTVIGVFFALAVGLAAMFLPAIRTAVNIDADQFLFGSVAVSAGSDLFVLVVLFVGTTLVVGGRFNQFVIASFNPSLARSRGVPIRLNSYLFIVLLALVVNLSIKAVGVLLINALLVVPAAAAANLGRNLRQVFWLTLAGSVMCGVVGLRLSDWVHVPLGGGQSLQFGPGGMIVVVCVGWFFLTMAIAAARGRRSGSDGDRAG
jgi:zinc transport system permease protein